MSLRLVKLFDGSKHTGTVLNENEKLLMIETRFYRIAIPKNQIVAIVKTDKLLTAINVEIISKKVV